MKLNENKTKIVAKRKNREQTQRRTADNDLNLSGLKMRETEECIFLNVLAFKLLEKGNLN